MFTHCVHCCQDLGKNEAVEHFLVGSKLAFASETGRLWVICPYCARWNLTPLEERWEAVEECERLFRGQRLRAQTSQMGYVKLADGTGLVRIGQPLRPEFAAWRYGREFSRRHTRAALALGVASFAATGLAMGSVYVGAAAVLPHLCMAAYQLVSTLAKAPEKIELPRGPGRSWTVSGDGTMILPDRAAGWHLVVRHHFGKAEYRGAEARRMLATLLARVNRSGGSDSLVRGAVTELEERRGDRLFAHVADQSEGFWSIDGPKQRAYDETEWQGKGSVRPSNRAGLSHLAPARRIALEMALHEHTEQRALEGELAELEAAWREAEEIAGIADNLLLPPGVEAFVDRHRPPRK